ncbi:MAG TPA: helix-turn-helix domain-containing protein [archaeon]|nr:helix-turn-helix domain-containing protein [archaeon]
MEQNPEALLKHLGLTEYEAKSYLALVKNGPLAADKVSSLANIPLPRVYDTMVSLSKRGLVIVSRSRPQVFRVTDPTQIFNILREDEKRKMEERLKEIESVIPQFVSSIKSYKKAEVGNALEEVLAYVNRRANIGKLWENMQTESKEEFLIFAGDISWGGQRIKEIKKLVKSGINYKVIWSKSSGTVLKNAKNIMKAGAELRYSESIGELRGIIVDGRKVLIIQKTTRSLEDTKEIKEGMPWSEKVADYTSIIITNKLIADVFRKYFYSVWKDSMPLERFLKRAERK